MQASCGYYIRTVGPRVISPGIAMSLLNNSDVNAVAPDLFKMLSKVAKWKKSQKQHDLFAVAEVSTAIKNPKQIVAPAKFWHLIDNGINSDIQTHVMYLPRVSRVAVKSPRQNPTCWIDVELKEKLLLRLSSPVLGVPSYRERTPNWPRKHSSDYRVFNTKDFKQYRGFLGITSRYRRCMRTCPWDAE